MDEIDWARYALDYDAMCDANPAYAENIEHLKKRVDVAASPPKPKVLDIKAGTGAFMSALGEVLDEAQYTPWTQSVHERTGAHQVQEPRAQCERYPKFFR